jgi:predicted DNA-binding protein
MRTTEPEETTTFSARLPRDLAEPLKVLVARHGKRSRVITNIIERGVRRELQAMGKLENGDAGASQALEMA